ncbi:hypothetical protein AWZ03_015076 [Drosophila navojoa]|uniref:Uncharacterized protein n=1 Tax=Drosophila navojoa TaxID=7232 RepID=A0A484AQW5_DRONA|nr:hypothetical protein AWZ03_015076 [Drosophila navojoa]
MPTDEESERWASLTPWAAGDDEDEDAAKEVPDQLPPREVGGGREHCPSAPNPASRVTSRAEAGEPEELWKRRSNRHEDVGPKPTTQRPLEGDAGESRRRDSARVALRYVPGAVDWPNQRTASGGPPRPACWVPERRWSIEPYWGHPMEATSELCRVTDKVAKARRFPSEGIQPPKGAR